MTPVSEHLARVTEALEATVIHSTVAFSWLGLRSSVVPRTRRLPDDVLRRYLLAALQARLYQSFYSQGTVTPVDDDVAAGPPRGEPAFRTALSVANTGEGYWSSGWQASAVDASSLVVGRGGLMLRAGSRSCRGVGGVSPEPGAPVLVHFPKEQNAESPGYYMAYGNRELPKRHDQTLIRLYLNLTPEGAIEWVRYATRLFNGLQIPFQLKVRNDPKEFRRCDTVVLYVEAERYRQVAAALEQLYPHLAPHLKKCVPVFCKRLIDGVGLAEDPSDGQSFGLHRCRILADGILRAFERQQRTTADRLGAVVACFRDSGINLDEPFLNPGANDVYRPIKPTASSVNSSQLNVTPPAEPAAYLRTAVRIADQLTMSAIWEGDRCNWMGYGSTSVGPELVASYAALGPDLYGGTSGVALFLGDVFRATGDMGAQRTAAGAMRHALSSVQTLPPMAYAGLYTGWVGIAMAAARLGVLLQSEELVKRAEEVVARVRAAHEARQACELDLLSGRAGAIVGLLILHGLLQRGDLLELAVQHGDELLRAADRTRDASSWRSPISEPGGRNLTGLSHGASGVSYGLLELFRATGESRFLAGAQAGFAYERRRFDPAKGNWLDLGWRLGHGPRSSFATLWCHGAPGIALARLRAVETTGDEACTSEAATGLDTTRRRVRRWLETGDANYSLCHGLAGLAEVLSLGAAVMKNDEPLYREVADAGIAALAKGRVAWPCGVSGGETPSLMLGLAGIGLFYLRLHCPEVPSVLMLRPEAFVHQSSSSASMM
jgi:hypothetical protein